MPSAISTLPISSGSSSSNLHVGKTAAAPSTCNLTLVSLRILSHWSAGSLIGGGSWSSRSVNCLTTWGWVGDFCENFLDQVVPSGHVVEWVCPGGQRNKMDIPWSRISLNAGSIGKSISWSHVSLKAELIKKGISWLHVSLNSGSDRKIISWSRVSLNAESVRKDWPECELGSYRATNVGSFLSLVDDKPAGAPRLEKSRGAQTCSTDHLLHTCTQFFIFVCLKYYAAR